MLDHLNTFETVLAVVMLTGVFWWLGRRPARRALRWFDRRQGRPSTMSVGWLHSQLRERKDPQ